ncbi:MAG: hypothetical protein HC796_03245 [Synechococcaceae cyanobacterium RL_1_2]|nr:hypothetical protein [Synechococcaceae cyanobacterium RL_1_2]
MTPLLCDRGASEPIPVRPYTTDADWYSFTVMVMQCLLSVHPFGGVYKPKHPGDQMPHGARPLRGITVFHPEVKYPKPAIPYQVLDDSLLHHFHHTFVKERRGKFPLDLLTKTTWDSCAQCGWEYSRPGGCPTCGQPLTFVPQVSQRQIQVTQIAKINGVFLEVVAYGHKLYWLSSDRGNFYRENNQCIFTNQANATNHYRFRLHPHYTVIITEDQAVSLYHQGQPSVYHPAKIAIDRLVQCNHHGRYWLQGGQLWRDGNLGPEYIGEVMAGQPIFGSGPILV